MDAQVTVQNIFITNVVDYAHLLQVQFNPIIKDFMVPSTVNGAEIQMVNQVIPIEKYEVWESLIPIAVDHSTHTLGIEFLYTAVGKSFTKHQSLLDVKQGSEWGVEQYTPAEATWTVNQDLVVDGVFRPPVQEDGPTGTYFIAGTCTDDTRVLVIDENTWEVEKTALKSDGPYMVDGLGSGLKMVISRKDDGETVAFGAVEAVNT